MTNPVWAQISPHGNISISCESCHTTDSWEMRTDTTFDHADTGFLLTGQHRDVTCMNCHTSLDFATTTSDCATCHVDVHQNELGADCLRCHTTNAWEIPDMRQKHQATRFPLLGIHATLECQACHAQETMRQYRGTPVDCVGCHRLDFDQTVDPNHLTAGFSSQCEQCHMVNSFTWDSSFDHNATDFPLTGSHTAVDCLSCHTNGIYDGLATNCVSCHLTSFVATTNPNHVTGNFTDDCESCHTTNAWEPAQFDHNITRFPLTGAHTPLDCESCHIDNNFQLVFSDCFQCHQQDFQETTDPNHLVGNFDHNCETCHSTLAWEPAQFDHNATRFPLTGAHVANTCESCHIDGNYQIVFANCAQCHQQDFQETTNPNHAGANFSQDCETCHTTIAWEPTDFDHNTTRFPLTGAHVAIATDCQTCHVNDIFAGLGNDCATCHLTDFNNTTNPNHAGANFSQNCETCHSTLVWEPTDFDHNTTRFPLTGAHVAIATDCQTCHVNDVFAGLGNDCTTCHLTDFNNTTNPNHVGANFSQNCETCHSTLAWEPSQFDHNTTNFPLTGAHVAIAADCQTCHVNDVFAGLGTDCTTCHLTDFTNTTNPNHVTNNFPQDCETCHTTLAWEPAEFDHNLTDFPLRGAHAGIATDCQVCHVNDNYQLVFNDCYQCHQQDFQQVTAPNHVTGNFDHNCETCHTDVAWVPSTFDHNTTNFPLTGAHETINCESCHINGDYLITYNNCYQCHQQDFQQAEEPNHVAANFSQNCETCHSTAVWEPTYFDHNATRFPLTGAHANIAQDCQTCHVNDVYAGLGRDCVTCHLNDYVATTNPNHVVNNFSDNCETCHTPQDWVPADFDHNLTDFPLTGAHRSIENNCITCHVNDNYQLVYVDCYQCHEPDFNRVTEPHHVNGNFSHTCESCHTTTVWSPSTFNHNNETNFPLTGAHIAVNCNSCHTSDVFAGLGTDCTTCHLTDFNNTTNPNHVTNNFSQDCESCHTTSAWEPAEFDHNQTDFPLTGAHRSIENNCQTCHINGNYQITFTDCYQCHQQDYQQAQNPNHQSANFPRDCESCHTTSAWEPADFDHDGQYFRIYSGRHRNRWDNSCETCHTNPSTFADFTCLECHEHNKTDEDRRHRNVRNYSYSSPRCLDCHSRV